MQNEMRWMAMLLLTYLALADEVLSCVAEKKTTKEI
jgi:hypothetical protein